MKKGLTQKEKKILIKLAKQDDWEVYHIQVDAIIVKRVSKELIKEIEKIDDEYGASYWFA